MNYTDSELEALGIRRTKARGRGRNETTAYIFKCARCGRETQRLQLLLSRPVYCNICKNDAKTKMKAAGKSEQQEAKELEGLLGIDHVSEDRFFKASQAVRKIGDYEQAISEAAAHAGKYGSVPEAIAAILLIDCGMSIIPQAKIFGNKLSSVDFLLPEHKAVVEIDGALYHSDAEKQFWRDEEIKNRLGDGWEILHIPAEALAKRPAAFKKLISKKFK